MKERGQGSVLNRTDIIYAIVRHKISGILSILTLTTSWEFLVLCALAYKGDIEICWSGSKALSATNIETLLNLSEEDFFTFQHIKEPQGIPVKNLKALLQVLAYPISHLNLKSQRTITRIITEAKTRVEIVVRTKSVVAQGLRCRNVALLTDDQAQR